MDQEHKPGCIQLALRYMICPRPNFTYSQLPPSSHSTRCEMVTCQHLPTSNHGCAKCSEWSPRNINKNMNGVIACAHALGKDDLYMLDVSPITQKVAANLANSPPKSIDVNILHRCLGHLGIDNCSTLVNCQLVDGVNKITGEEEFCKGCAYRQLRWKHHPPTGTKTKQ